MNRARTEAELLSAVEVVAQFTNNAQPSNVTQRAFDNTRNQAGVSWCPNARNLCRRFDMRWQDLLNLAARERAMRSRAMQVRSQAEYAGGVVDQRIRFAAMALIAKRLGARTLTPDQYETERTRLLASARGPRRQDLIDRLPTVGQLPAAGEWDDALTAAGLQRRSSASRQVQSASTSLVDLAEWFLTEQGRLPTRRDLKRFAHEKHVAVPRNAEGLPEAIEAMRQRRSVAGRWTPASASTTKRRPPWYYPDEKSSVSKAGTSDWQTDRPASAQTAFRQNYWTLELVKAGLLIAVQELTPGERLNQPTLRRLAQQHHDIPSPDTVTRIARNHGTTFSAMRDEAVRHAVTNEARREP